MYCRVDVAVCACVRVRVRVCVCVCCLYLERGCEAWRVEGPVRASPAVGLGGALASHPVQLTPRQVEPYDTPIHTHTHTRKHTTRARTEETTLLTHARVRMRHSQAAAASRTADTARARV